MRQPDVFALDLPLRPESPVMLDDDSPPAVLSAHESAHDSAHDSAHESAHESGVSQARRGMLVEVRCRFDGRWSPGFLVDLVDEEGAWLRRLSDGALIPVPFGPTDLRPAVAG